MSIKRTLFAFSALMMLPAVALAQLPPVSPDLGTANIAVQHLFADGNTEDSAVITLSCTSGSISPSSVTLGDGEGHIFVIADIPDVLGGIDCTVTQTVIDDYDATYLCAPDINELPDNGIPGDDQCGNPAGSILDWSTTSCSWSGVDEGDVGYCIVASVPEPVDVDVTKVWETLGAEQADFDVDVLITLFCPDALRIVDGTEFGNGPQRSIWLREDDGDFDDEDDDYIGEGTAEFEVIPTWYPTESDPDDQLFTECYATENISDSAIETDNGCGANATDAAIEIEAGLGDECTITNTVFFEGIPTLSQYGMAIMALLMLGVGFVGMRRFV